MRLVGFSPKLRIATFWPALAAVATASALLWALLPGLFEESAALQLRVRGKETPLTATEFRLLRLLMERGGRVQTRGQLLSDVWGYAEDIDSRTVDTHIRRLRRKLGSEADHIETVIGVGYRLRP